MACTLSCPLCHVLAAGTYLDSKFLAWVEEACAARRLSVPPPQQLERLIELKLEPDQLRSRIIRMFAGGESSRQCLSCVCIDARQYKSASIDMHCYRQYNDMYRFTCVQLSLLLQVETGWIRGLPGFKPYARAAGTSAAALSALTSHH